VPGAIIGKLGANHLKIFDENSFRALAHPPDNQNIEWLLGAEDSIAFLQDNAKSEELVIYAGTDVALIHGVLAPTNQVTPANQDDLLRSHILPDDSWCIQKEQSRQGRRIYLDPPLSSPGCNSLASGEKLIFRREFTGVASGPAPIELSQKLVHSLGLYWLEERNSYCRLDSRGDIEDVIRVIWLKESGQRRIGVVVTILTKDLVTYMALTETSLVLNFDFTRTDPESFHGWNPDTQRRSNYAADLFYDMGQSTSASYVHGCMILRPSLTVQDLIQEWIDEDDPRNRQYATFKIQDWKNKCLVETSCAPGFLSNYFESSDKPFEISPVFFRPEVLARFKNDPEKYDLQDRTIHCRNAWYLNTYDINEVGQVHTYIGYLAKLPYEEQCYWQSFNEWPKAPISKRAFENDIQGAWASEYDPLQSLKAKITRLDRMSVPWWNPRGTELSDAARYPATDSISEWGDEILALDQLIVEGFLHKPLQKLAEDAGRAIDKQWRSLRLLQDYLEAHGASTDDARETLRPLSTLHGLRSILKGHAAPTKRNTAAKQARTDHCTLRAHFKALAGECDQALTIIFHELGVPVDA
jgi:hypothetical protein